MIGFVLLVLLPVGPMADDHMRPAHSRAVHYTFSDQAGNYERSSGVGLSGTGAALPAPSYQLSGEKSLRPVRMGDDGVHMYLEWSEEQALPAVFALNAIGEEEMVDGYMRQGIFTIDRVHQTLIFRIGKKRARADRVSR